MVDGIGVQHSRPEVIGELRARLGPGSWDVLGRLPDPELRYLLARPRLIRRYREMRRGRLVMELEMSAVERGTGTLAEVDRVAPAEWQGCRALDMGCGDGGLLVALAQRGARAYGVDLEPHNVTGARLWAAAWGVTVQVVNGSIVELPFRPSSISFVACGDVVEHVRERGQAIGEAARVLEPGGLLWLSAPTRFRLRNLRADPHYGYFVVAALPARWGAWYVSKVRRGLASPRDFEVETLPLASSLHRLLRGAGFTVVAGEMAHRRAPESLVTPWKRSVVKAVRKAGLAPAFALVGVVRAELFEPLTAICRKDG